MKQQGFTLIELAVVIIILGILSAIAVPKYISLKRDARIATLEGIKGAMSSTSTLVEMKAQVEGVGESGSIEIDGKAILISHSYIAGHWNSAWRHALNIGKDITYTRVNLACTLNDICAVGNQSNHSGVPNDIITSGNGLVMFWLEGDKLEEHCYAYYYNPSDGNTPSIGIVNEGC